MLRNFNRLTILAGVLILAACGGGGVPAQDIFQEVAEDSGWPGDAGGDEAVSVDIAGDEGVPDDTTVDEGDAGDEGDAVQPKICSVRAHGAVGDGETLDTAALQAAIDECAGTGGVTVVEPGTYLTGTIFIKSRMTFRIQDGARILGSTNEEDYDGKALVAIRDAEDVTVEGPGIIDGNGPTWWFWHWVNTSAYRPERMLQPINSRNLVFRNLWLQDSAGWHFHLVACDDVLIEYVTIRTLVDETDQSPNTDGIDIDGCRNVEVRNCDIETGDDAIVLKNSSGEWARESYNINVHDCTVSAWANGLKIGTRPTKPVHDVVFRDIVVQASVHTNPGTRVMGGVTLLADDGADVYNVLAERIHMKAVRSPFFLRVQERILDDEGDRRTEAGRLYNVTLKDITVDDCQIPGMIMGIPGFPVENVRLENVSIVSSVAGTVEDRDIVPDERNLEYPDAIYFGTMPAFGVYARHVTGPLDFAGEVTFSSTSGEKRAAVILDDVAQYDLAGILGEPEIIISGTR